jgi:hypothetical protein
MPHLSTFDAAGGVMSDIFVLERNTVVPIDNSYILSYRAIREFFAAKAAFTISDFVCGTHMVYGWMPTALDLYPNPPNIGLQGGADLLTKAKVAGTLSDDEIGQLAQLVNKSVVGASKLLHFVAPRVFAIWDSRIYRFLFRQAAHHYRVNVVNTYRNYLSHLHQLREDPRFAVFHTSVNDKLGYAVSDLRALEMVMFLNSPE